MRNPIAAGRNESFPISALLSSAGSSRLQNEAATITPAANPVRILFSPSEICRRRINTIAAPRLVPANGIRIPSMVSPVIICLSFPGYFSIWSFRYSDGVLPVIFLKICVKCEEEANPTASPASEMLRRPSARNSPAFSQRT